MSSISGFEMNKRLVELLADVFGLRAAEIRPELSKNEVGSWDSLKQMDLVVTLEREFDIVIEIADIQRMVTVGAIMDVLREKGVAVEA
jgi:acyl carrier protein